MLRSNFNIILVHLMIFNLFFEFSRYFFGVFVFYFGGFGPALVRNMYLSRATFPHIEPN